MKTRKLSAKRKTARKAIEIIERTKPDLALLDLQMPEIGGLEVVKLLRKSSLPLVAFVTAYDEFAVRAFEVNAVDYLLKPVDEIRLRETLNRAHERLEQTDFRKIETENLRRAVDDYEKNARQTFPRKNSGAPARRNNFAARR